MTGAVGSRGGWQDLDIAACIPEATGLISSHDNVPRNVDSPPLSSIAWREYLCQVACRVRQLRDRVLRGQVFNSAVAFFFLTFTAPLHSLTCHRVDIEINIFSQSFICIYEMTGLKNSTWWHLRDGSQILQIIQIVYL